MESSPRRRLLIAAAVVAAVVAAVSLAWRHTALAELVTVDRVAEVIEAASGRWWTPLLVVALFTPAALVLFPRALITLAAAMVLGPVKAFVLAMTGVVLSAWLLQAAGRRVSEPTVRRIAGPRIDRLTRMLRKQGLMAVAAVGFLPVAPFAVEMLVAGALRIPLLHLLPGVALAHLPGTIFTTLLGDQALAAISHDREMNRGVLAGVAIAFAALAWWTRRWWRRVQAQAA
ncbi:MAG TPA: VTT domain-containing protein [Usitatibacter sp.]|nr:VTT domain-containing protein [Usitatibacter sp.]